MCDIKTIDRQNIRNFPWKDVCSFACLLLLNLLLDISLLSLVAWQVTRIIAHIDYTAFCSILSVQTCAVSVPFFTKHITSSWVCLSQICCEVYHLPSFPILFTFHFCDSMACMLLMSCTPLCLQSGRRGRGLRSLPGKEGKLQGTNSLYFFSLVDTSRLFQLQQEFYCLIYFIDLHLQSILQWFCVLHHAPFPPQVTPIPIPRLFDLNSALHILCVWNSNSLSLPVCGVLYTPLHL